MLNSIHYFGLWLLSQPESKQLDCTQGAKVLLKGLVHRNNIYMTDANQKGTHSPHYAVERIFVLRSWLVKALNELPGH